MLIQETADLFEGQTVLLKCSLEFVSRTIL